MRSVIGQVVGLTVLGAIATGLWQSVSAQSLVIVSSTQGRVSFSRGGGSFQSVSAGTRLQASDLVRVQSGGVALICPNRATPRVNGTTTFSVVQQCPTASPVVRRNNGVLRSPSIVEDATIPYLLNPLSPQEVDTVDSLTPTFRWHGVKGVTSYEVYLSGQGQQQRPTPVTVTGTEWTYDGPLPLQYGRDYRITVVAAGTACDRLSSTNVCSAKFQVFMPDEMAAVDEAIADLQTSQFDEAVRALAIADVYRQYQLYGEAIAVLDAAIDAGHAMISTQQMLAELYDEVGYYAAAQTHYLAAHHQSQAEQDLITQATVEHSLGQLNLSLKQVPTAIAWLQKAQATYIAFNDQDSAAAVAAELERLDAETGINSPP